MHLNIPFLIFFLFKTSKFPLFRVYSPDPEARKSTRIIIINN